MNTDALMMMMMVERNASCSINALIYLDLTGESSCD